MSRFSGAPPADCDKGIAIRTANIGAVFDAPPGTDFSQVTPLTYFKAQRRDGTIAANTVIAQPVNLGPTSVTAPMIARFRLAAWGSAPWTPGDTGKWRDMRGAENGVCGAGAPPSCAPFVIPPLVDANHDGVPDPGTSNRAAITFQWTLGSDPTIGASEHCKFGLEPPGGTCAECSCAGSPRCDTPADPGTLAIVGDITWPCVSKSYGHQCMYVELAAPNGNVDFVQQSSWNNMSFAQMSSTAREALIDARRLPRGRSQRYQDIYLIAMARNMPRAIPGGAQTGASYVYDHTLARVEKLGEAYRKDLGRLSPQQLAAIAGKLGRGPQPPWHPLPCNPRDPACGGAPWDPLRTYAGRIEKFQKQLVIMPDRDLALAQRLIRIVKPSASADALTKDVVRELGPEEAAGVVPTLEVYPFYRPFDAGNVYMPMTAFTVFLSHEGSMKGMAWQIDGATQVGQNVYHLRIPVGFARRIQIRAQALETNEPPAAAPNPKWPCGGCCAPKNCGLVAQTGNGLPVLLACCYVILGGRRRRPAPPPGW